MKKKYFLFVFLSFFLLLTLTAQNTPPVFTSTPNTILNEGDNFSYTIVTNDVDGDQVIVSTTILPAWLSVTELGVVTTLAGDGTYGFNDGAATAAKFSLPQGVAIDASGNIYVADSENNSIRKVTSAGVVTTIAGDGTFGYADGMGTAAKFSGPRGIAIDNKDNLYIADTDNNRIRKIAPSGEVTTLAGNGTAGFANGTGHEVQFDTPIGVTVDTSGNVYVADTGNNQIRKITPSGVVTTLAGSTTAGYKDGDVTVALFNLPYAVTVDTSGSKYVADSQNNLIRKITPSGVVSTLAGDISFGFVDGTGTHTKFNFPDGIAVDNSGNLYVADRANNRIRKVTPSGVVTTLAGNSRADFKDGTGTNATFNLPVGIAVGSSGDIYIGDQGNHRIRKLIKTVTMLSGGSAGIGTYDVVLKADDSHGGTNEQRFTITVSAALGIEDNVIKGFAMYPNPVGGILNINTQEIIKRLQVYNLLGQQVSDKSFNTANAIIDLRLLPSGTYFVKVTTDKIVKSVKIIKN